MRNAAPSVALVAASMFGFVPSARALELPYREAKLQNGLTVIVHEDHVLPMVATNIIYKVGSRDEDRGRTGFAHLFEHLMFMGTRRVPSKAFDAWMEAAGGSNNAWTSSDFTDYHEVGPSGLLGLFLWLEADRLETLGREIDQPKLDLQRDVVLNERRQEIENRPYGKVELRLPELVYPAEHPYHHPVIGSPADLKAATVEDVRSFFEKHYTPDSAALVIAGDVDAGDAIARAERYFGFIARKRESVASPPPSPPPRLGKVVRETLEDQVEMTKIVMAFPSPAHFAPGDAELDILGSVLATGKVSRLYRALVYEKALAQSVTASQQSSLLASMFTVEIMVRPGVDADLVEKQTDAVLADLALHPPTNEELQRAKNQIMFDFVDHLQSLPARATVLSTYWAEKGDPGYVNQDLHRYEMATAKSVDEQAKKTVTLGERVILRVIPVGGAKGGSKPPSGGGERR